MFVSWTCDSRVGAARPPWEDRFVLVDRDALERHRSAIHEGPDGPFVWGEFERLHAGCHVASALGRQEVDAVNRHLKAVANRQSDLRTVAAKLQWMLERRDSGDLDPMAWMAFASSDARFFL